MKTKSLPCAILCFLTYFVQAVLHSLLTGTFHIADNTAEIASCLFAISVAALLVRNKKRAEYFGLAATEAKVSPLFYLPLLVIPMINLLYLLYPAQTAAQDILMILFRGIYIGIIEELIFRSFLFRAIEEKAGANLAVVVSSIVFGMYHLVNISAAETGLVVIQVIYATAIGVSFAIVFYISKSILPCIAVHALTDITGYFFIENEIFEIERIGIGITFLVAAFYVFVYIKTRNSSIAIH